MSILVKTAVGSTASLVLVAFVSAAAAQQPAPKPTPARPTQPAQHQAPAAPAPQAQAAPAPAVVDQNPQRTTASYGDWVVRCETVAGPPPQKNCEMDQLAQTQVQGQTAPISRVLIPLPAKGEPPKLYVQLPVNVSFTAPLKITVDAKDAGISTPFRRCVPNGCIVEIDLKDDLQKKFRAAAAEPGKIVYKNAGDQDMTIPLSFKGFAQAFDALVKQ